jgi:hypothetical protein
MLEVV